ncbi:MAG: TspO/MBR family protein [Bacteroidota bacterium]|nr:TspO/MBR family protein [Bacteroidota bacterium]
MRRIYKIIGFLILNLLILYLGSFLSQDGPNSNWYQDINKAPWTPPGWVFGVAWTTIMICFSFYLAELFDKKERYIKGGILFILQIILNIIWNPIFFYFHNIPLALLDISLLLILICSIFIIYFHELRLKSLLLAPYIVWLIIAISLNSYIWLFN